MTIIGCLFCVLPSLVSAFHMGGDGRHAPHVSGTDLARRRLLASMTSSPSEEAQATSPNEPMSIADATQILTDFDARQQAFMQEDGMSGMGGGTSAFKFITTAITKEDRQQVKQAASTLVQQALADRAEDSSKGRIMLGICASNAPEALGGLKSWVTTLALPRGMLHGADVDGVPIPFEELGSVYVKFSTGGAMTFQQMRASKMGFDALWRPGDALLEPYDGAFRGVYLNVELEDNEFRQFGVLPTDLFEEEEEEDW